MVRLERLKRWFRAELSHPRAGGNGHPHGALFSGGRRPERAPHDGLSSGVTTEALRRLERQMLFVIGCARSGTTALARALNRSPELLLLEEPNFFANCGQRDFATFFNEMHRTWGSARMKGTYVRPPLEPEIGPLPLLVRLAQEYRYVGGKLAFGPADEGYNWPEAFFLFHAKYFFHARRLLITRRPTESIWSMHKMFPDRRLPQLFATWLKSAAACIECYRVFPRVKWMFFEDLCAAAVEKFAATIPLEIDVPPSMLARSYVGSNVAEGELPPPLAPYAEWCAACSEIYQSLRENFCRESLLYCGSRSEWDFFDDVQKRIGELTAEAAGRQVGGRR